MGLLTAGSSSTVWLIAINLNSIAPAAPAERRPNTTGCSPNYSDSTTSRGCRRKGTGEKCAHTRYEPAFLLQKPCFSRRKCENSTPSSWRTTAAKKLPLDSLMHIHRRYSHTKRGRASCSASQPARRLFFLKCTPHHQHTR
jgi:hypothetical protein